MSKPKIAGIAVGALIIGIIIGGAGDTQVVEKEVQVEKIVEQPVEVERNVDQWRKLKEIDDQAFSVAIKNSELCAAGFYAVSKGDVGTIQAVTDETKKTIEEFDKLGGEREEILTELGY
jgi:hypothetical protein